jgi:hypothetical protein
VVIFILADWLSESVTPIKHISRKNQCIFGVGLANHLILLIAKFSDTDEARKTWCGKYLN